MEKIEAAFAIMVVLLMLSNTIFLRAYLDFGWFSIATIIALIGVGFFFISVNLAFSKAIGKIKKYKEKECLKKI